ncbi:helix-turn-helix domain-containing protein [Caulobacter sp. UNC358MFTsu5.1]|uniref:winged helix-turn-helix transcriptional regulator n=1 Tax=Caulobacter sp. UNC358MFTsu5.1 TaxID=1449049 RepID=UPI0004A720DB|nr:helix-turn-helix domain-containing protein [Caulobacter sp. UNC358MFTsu5.1]
MSQRSYGQFCPVAMAAEILCTRWTVVLLREMVAGSTRFNDLRRGVPRMSPALLVQRLRDLEDHGVVRRVAGRDSGVLEYHLTPAGQELETLVGAMGHWGQRWVTSELSLQQLDASLLMWDMRRHLDLEPMPRRRSVIQFLYAEQAAVDRSWWLIVEPDAGPHAGKAGAPVDLCSVEPGFDVDLYVACDLKTMTGIWMGVDTVRAALDSQRMHLTGDAELASNMQSWLGLSPFAKTRKLAS